MPRKKISHSIKIIGIRPLADCKKDYVKVLQQNKIYTLYKDYQIDPETESITYTPSIPERLFDQRGISINISAIAGYNGAGKSTLVELMFMAINNIGYVNNLHTELELVNGISVDLYCVIGELYKIQVKNESIQIFGYDGNNAIRKKPIENFNLNDLFFTIAINYSLYAYNSLEMKPENRDWLNGLFHKNDSYQTPLVINPWRNTGNIDINNENGLVRLRLMANLLRKMPEGEFNFRRITDNLAAVKLRLTVNREKSKRVIYRLSDGITKGKSQDIYLKDLHKIDKHKILSELNGLFEFGYQQSMSPVDEIATDYLIGKLITVAVTYDDYKDMGYYLRTEGNFDMNRLGEYLKLILDDPSHIAFKIKQTLNYLQYRYLELKDQDIEISELSDIIHDILEKQKGDEHKIEELIPPPIFRVDILLAPIADLDTKELILFKTLSSGERQMVYSISSLIYHLTNIDSVSRRGRKIKYRFVNIVLEEVELYFHPEMQRGFIKKLLNSIANIDLQYIKGINICFVTHSPFILSDIPHSNVMFLKVEDGISQIANRHEKTFGANIHDLLADGFFMYNGLIGEFAARKIEETIRFLEYTDRMKMFDEEYGHGTEVAKSVQLDDKAKRTRQIKKDEIDALYDSFSEKDKNEHLKLIKLIGEPVLSIKLSEMYSKVFQRDLKDILLEQIAELQERVNNL